MSQQFDELERRIGYRFHNRDHLRRALTCQSAINENHPNATDQNFQILEFLGDAVLKYVVATILYTEKNDFRSPGNIHDSVGPYIHNSNLTRIGNELDLSKYIIKGRGVVYVTEKMLGDAVEAILGAIVIDQQQQQENNAENVLFDVIARLFSIQRTRRSTPLVQNNINKKRCSCCKCLGIILTIIIFVFMTLVVIDRADL